MNGTIDPYDVALAVVGVLDALGVANTVGGSIASSFAGEPRSTIDIDIVAALEEVHVEPLVAALSGAFYVDEDAVRRAIRQRSSANLIHHKTLLKVDLFVAGGTPLDAQQLARRQAVTLGPGRILHVHPPEDILLQEAALVQTGRRGLGSAVARRRGDRQGAGRPARPRLPSSKCSPAGRRGLATARAGRGALRNQYRQDFKSAPGGAVSSIRFRIVGRYIVL